MTKNTARGPDFLIIGAQKSGTTSLYRYLIQHPRIAPASAKELDFFSNDNFHRGVDWYLSQFPPKEPGVLTGEASPYYMFHPYAPRRILEFDPGIKLIVVMRNPVERTYSHYHHQVHAYREMLSFEEALAREEERLEGEIARMKEDETYHSKAHRRFSYLAKSRYTEQLEVWFSLFPREQMLILNSEAMFRNPEPVLDAVTSFLGLPPLRLDAYNRYMPGSYWEEMRPETRRMLIRYFRPHNRRLYELLGERYPWDA
jgi:hypothetical protein